MSPLENAPVQRWEREPAWRTRGCAGGAAGLPSCPRYKGEEPNMENGASRVALVTGAARGIGKGIALRLAADGLDVAVNDIEANSGELDGVAEEIRNAGRRAATVVADVSQPDEVEGIVGRVAEELGRLDVMVANAGTPWRLWGRCPSG